MGVELGTGVGFSMGYIFLMLAAVLLIPIVFFLLRQPQHPPRPARPSDKGVTPLEPASDQPTPTEPSINPSPPEVGTKLPPG